MWRFGKQHSFDLEPVVVNGRDYGVDTVLTDGRTASASLRDGRIVRRIPRAAGEEQAATLFRNLKQRIARSLERHPERFERQALLLKHGSILRISGRTFRIDVEEGAGRGAHAWVYADRILVRMPEGFCRDWALVTRIVLGALSRTFQPMAEARVSELNAAHVNASIRRVRLKNTSSRWGSYSKRSRNISLSVKLLFAPQEIMDYVIVHELSHSMEHNHGPKFWALVSKTVPDYKERRRWLRRYGDRLGSEASSTDIAGRHAERRPGLSGLPETSLRAP